MNAEMTIEKAKVALIMNEPFFATLALQKEYIADPSVGTASVNGRVIRYAPAFIESLSVDECATLLAHECLHPAFLHHLRRNGRDPQDWNKACDYAINGILRDSRFKLPSDALIDPKFDGKSAEDIYASLHEIIPPEASGEPTEDSEDSTDDQQDENQSSGGGSGDDGDTGRIASRVTLTSRSRGMSPPKMTLKMAMTKGMAEAVTKMVMVASPSRMIPGLILTPLKVGGRLRTTGGMTPKRRRPKSGSNWLRPCRPPR